VTASEAVTLRIDRDELRAAGRRAHTAGKLSDEQLRRIEALCEGDLPSGKPTVDLADGPIADALDLDAVEVEWVNVPFPQGGLVSSPPPPMPVGEISAEWLSDSLVLEGERSAEWLSDSLVLEGEVSAVMLGDSAVLEGEVSAVMLGDSAILEDVPAAWLGDSAVLEAEESAIALGDSQILDGEASADWDPAVLAAPERSQEWSGSVVAAPAAVIRAPFESSVAHEEWPEAAASDDAPSVPYAAPAMHHLAAAPAAWSAAAYGDEYVHDARFPGDDGTGSEDAQITNMRGNAGPAAPMGSFEESAREGWAHLGPSAPAEGPSSDNKATLPPVVGAVSLPSPRRMLAAPRVEPALPVHVASLTPARPGEMASFHVASLTPARVEPLSPMRLAARGGGTLLSAQPTAASVSGSSGFAPLHAGTKLRQPLLVSDASVLASDSAMVGRKPQEDPSSITARYPWVGPVLFAAALILGLIGEWIISTPSPAPSVATATPKVEAVQVAQPTSVSTPSITLVGAPANAR